ncbi:MAG: hypothetical protein R3D71_04480 [Rickettsiales bacterium]
MPQLDPTWFVSQLFWLFVSFTLLYQLLSKMILPRLLGVIDERIGTMKSDLDAAREMKERAQQARDSYEETLKKSKQAARSLIIESQLSCKTRAEEANKSLDEQIAAQSAKAAASISAKKTELLKNLTPDAMEFSSLIVKKLTNKSPSDSQLKTAFEKATSIN